MKSDAVLRVLRGEDASAVAAELAVPVQTLETWRTEFLQAAMTGFKGA